MGAIVTENLRRKRQETQLHESQTEKARETQLHEISIKKTPSQNSYGSYRTTKNNLTSNLLPPRIISY